MTNEKRARRRPVQGEPADDEREAMLLAVMEGVERWADLLPTPELSGYITDYLLKEGFRRPVQAEPTDAQLADIESRVYDAHRGQVAGMAKEMVRAGWHAALKEGENR